MRDKAMLELLYATGVRVSELISLKLEDVNMQIGYITCHDGTRERMIPFGKGAKQALRVYLDEARSSLLKGRTCEWLFTNCSGQPMSRQGFWKLIKFYGGKSGDQDRYHTSYPAPFLCGPPYGRRRGYPCSPGHVRGMEIPAPPRCTQYIQRLQLPGQVGKNIMSIVRVFLTICP